MNTRRVVPRRRIGTFAVLLCGLAGAFPTGSPVEWSAPFVLAAESNESAAEAERPADDAPAQPDARAEGESDAPGNAPDEAAAEAEAEDDESEEIFVPSEDISEDIDVPFPVDI